MDPGNVRPRMDVVGSDGEHLGTAEHADHNRIELRRNDPASDGQHHWRPQEAIASVDGNTVRPTVSAGGARRSWQAKAGQPR